MDDEKTLSSIPRGYRLPSPGAKRTTELGFTVNELLILSAVVLTIFALAVPGILRVRSQARNEASAITLLRTVASSEAAYSKSCGSGGYAANFTVLDKSTPHSDTGFVSPVFSQPKSPRQNGYSFKLSAGAGAAAGPLDCHGIPTWTAYFATAQPISFGIVGTGNRSFAITEKKIVWQIQSAAAPNEPFAKPAVPLR